MFVECGGKEEIRNYPRAHFRDKPHGLQGLQPGGMCRTSPSVVPRVKRTGLQNTAATGGTAWVGAVLICHARLEEIGFDVGIDIVDSHGALLVRVSDQHCLKPECQESVGHSRGDWFPEPEKSPPHLA